MRAALIDAPGGAIRIAELPGPLSPGPHQLVVRMLRAPVNPADVLTAQGRYSFASKFPFVLGAEGVGVVSEVGAAVDAVRPGDRVLPLPRGNWATHRVLGQHEVLRVPPDIPLEQAAMLRINPATAWRLQRLASLRAGDSVVQNGAGSIVARWVRAIARGLGVKVIDIVRPGGRQPEDAEAILDGPDLAKRVAAIVCGGPVPLALDCVAGEASGRLAAVLSPGGTLAVFGHLSGEPCSIPSTLLTGHGITVKGFSLRPAEAGATPTELAELYGKLFSLFSRAALQIPIAATYPLDEAALALQHARQPMIAGRVMLTLDA